jgi:hypothetical protein
VSGVSGADGSIAVGKEDEKGEGKEMGEGMEKETGYGKRKW